MALWEVPYLPIDPADVGRGYDSVMRVNSQSGKGGISYLLETGYGLTMPRRLQVEFSAVVQKLADATGGELSGEQLWNLFRAEYLQRAEPVKLIAHHSTETGERVSVQLEVEVFGRRMVLQGIGNGPLDAAVHALGVPLRLDGYEEKATSGGSDASAIAFVELAAPGVAGSAFGVGQHTNIVTASVLALVSGINRLHAARGGRA